MMRFDRFSERAQDAAMRAYEVLQRYGHTQVDTEHLLLALVEQPDGVIPEILDRLDVDLDALVRHLDEELRRSPRTTRYGSAGVNQVYITPRLKRVIDQSNEEASSLEDTYISTEHLFLAIACERTTPAGRMLSEVGVNRQRILDRLAEARAGQEATQPRRRRAIFYPLPLKDITIDTVAGDEPALVLTQGDDTITVKLPEVLALAGALANAAVNLAAHLPPLEGGQGGVKSSSSPGPPPSATPSPPTE